MARQQARPGESQRGVDALPAQVEGDGRGIGCAEGEGVGAGQIDERTVIDTRHAGWRPVCRGIPITAVRIVPSHDIDRGEAEAHGGRRAWRGAGGGAVGEGIVAEIVRIGVVGKDSAALVNNGAVGGLGEVENVQRIAIHIPIIGQHAGDDQRVRLGGDKRPVLHGERSIGHGFDHQPNGGAAGLQHAITGRVGETLAAIEIGHRHISHASGGISDQRGHGGDLRTELRNIAGHHLIESALLRQAAHGELECLAIGVGGRQREDGSVIFQQALDHAAGRQVRRLADGHAGRHACAQDAVAAVRSGVQCECAVGLIEGPSGGEVRSGGRDRVEGREQDFGGREGAFPQAHLVHSPRQRAAPILVT